MQYLSKCKKSIDQCRIEYELRDIVKEPLTKEELKEIIDRSGFDIKKFFNTSGLKYKELNLKDKLPNLTEEEKIELLASDGMLVKRPILLVNGNVIIGKKEKEYEEVIR